MSRAPTSREVGGATAVLAACLIGAYSALALAGFVFDDVPLVVQNTLTGNPARWREAFGTDLWRTAGVEEFSGYYRPLMLLDLMLDRTVFGLSPAAHHLHSLAWHLLAVGLFLALLRRLVPPTPALVGAAVFALHPLQSEAVAWIAARNDLMVASFMFAALLVLLPARAGPARLLTGFTLALAGLLTKESAVLMPIALLGLDLARDRRPGAPARYAACGLAIALWWGLRTTADIPPASVPSSGQLLALLHSLPELAAHYAALIVLPYPLSIGAFLPYLEARPLQYFLLAVLLAGLALCVRRGGPLAWAGLTIAAVSLAPSLLAIAVRGQIGERYLYVPVAGVAVALAAAVPDRRATLAVAGPIAFVWLVILHGRVPEWSSDHSLWESANAHTPSPYTEHSLAAALVAEGRSAEAIVHYQAALAAPLPWKASCLPAVTLPLSLGDAEAAARGARLVISAHCPRSAPLAAAAGRAALDAGDLALARRLTDGIDPAGHAGLLAVLADLELAENPADPY